MLLSLVHMRIILNVCIYIWEIYIDVRVFPNGIFPIDSVPADGWCPLFRLHFFCDQVRRKSGPTVSSKAVCGPEQKRIGHIIRSH